MQMLDWDRNYQVYKLNPLLNWNLVEVEDYLKEHNVPYNSLHHKGFVSIGCAPCTRAINSGEDFRSGRWWWEHNSTKECGLHSNQ
jgi:phosphoadenosine phosphosulfate reductase